MVSRVVWGLNLRFGLEVIHNQAKAPKQRRRQVHFFRLHHLKTGKNSQPYHKRKYFLFFLAVGVFGQIA
jgi:hypothetical protein